MHEVARRRGRYRHKDGVGGRGNKEINKARDIGFNLDTHHKTKWYPSSVGAAVRRGLAW